MKQSKGDKKAYAMLESLSFDLPQKMPLWLHHSSSSFFFFNGVFENEREFVYEFSP